jgi:hypothetical protein
MVGFGHQARSRVDTPFSYIILLIMFGNKKDSRESLDLNLIYPALLAQRKGVFDYNTFRMTKGLLSNTKLMVSRA